MVLSSDASPIGVIARLDMFRYNDAFHVIFSLFEKKRLYLLHVYFYIVDVISDVNKIYSTHRAVLQVLKPNYNYDIIDYISCEHASTANSRRICRKRFIY